MAIKFEKIQAGMTLYDVRKNTGLGRWKWNTWPVEVKEVDVVNRTALVSWNHNNIEWWSERRLTKLRAKIPE